jgi:hypothetical protein
MNIPFITKKQIINQEQILVLIRGDPPDHEVTKTAIRTSDGRIRVIMEPTLPNKAGWSFDATNSIRTMIRNGKQMQYVEVIYGARQAIQFDLKTNEVHLKPLNLDQFKELINMDIFKAVFGKLKEALALKPLLFVCIGVSIGALIAAGYGVYVATQTKDTVIQIAQYLAPSPAPGA